MERIQTVAFGVRGEGALRCSVIAVGISTAEAGGDINGIHLRRGRKKQIGQVIDLGRLGVIGGKLAFADLKAADAEKCTVLGDHRNTQKHDTHFCSRNRHQIRETERFRNRKCGVL